MAAGLASVPQLSGGVPKGYVRLLVFDADSNLVSQQVQQLSNAALNNYEDLRLQVVVPQDGYVTAYVGNESNVDVLFDDVQVEYRQGLQIQENQYDPWGLSLAGLDYSSPGTVQINKNQFNGKEQERELGLNWQDFNWRHYDPGTARFFGADRLAEKFVYLTDYQFASNNPTSKIELDGLEGVSAHQLQGMILNTTPFNCHHCGQNGLQPMTGRASPRQDAFFNGISNLTFGIVGSAGAIVGIPETGGISAGALVLTVPEIGIGMAQVTDALLGNNFDENSVLQQSSSIPGLVAYGANSEYAPYIDAAGQFVPGIISGGNIVGGFKGVGETMQSLIKRKLGKAAFEGLSTVDAYLDATGLLDATSGGKNPGSTGPKPSQKSQASQESSKSSNRAATPPTQMSNQAYQALRDQYVGAIVR